jgi:16S rRNA (adenine1518-N6/adenine1519-N6)-dimethyltransferase
MSSPTETRLLLERHGIRPTKRLGQHFLVDDNIVDRIVRVSGVSAGDLVIEVGAGTGVLTGALLAAGAEVISYEVDERLRPVLQETAPAADLRFVDVTGVDLAEGLDRPAALVANLPYNIGTRLILDVLRKVPEIERLTVMVQKEVGERLVASVGSPNFGLPSVVARLWGNASLEFSVPPQVFLPPPDVESAVVSIDRRTPQRHSGEAAALAAIGFGQRRKTLRRSLRSALGDPDAVLRAAEVDPGARPEELEPEMWLRIVEASRD